MIENSIQHGVGQKHLAVAEREAGEIPGFDTRTPARPVNRVGILGAGTMGGGIAMSFVNAGIPVTLVDATAEGLARGLDRVRRNYEASAARGRMTSEQVEQRMGLISGGTQDAELAECDLVIEAVFEDLDLKQRVCARLGNITKPGTIIATNTSTLDVDFLAQASGRPTDVVGMHFFSPANVMRLLEIVRGAATAPDVLWTAMGLANRIGKVAVVSGVCYGFIGNRMAEVYLREADFLLMEGAGSQSVDASVEALGMAMGPLRMLDMAGVDVGAGTVIERAKAGGLPPDPSYRAVVRALFEQGRLGQKTEAGYYDYQGRTPVPAPELDRIAAGLADAHGIARRTDIDQDEMAERLLYPLINEGLHILHEGISYRPGDIDVVWTAGYGFPADRGGPMFMADQIGLRKIADRLAHYAAISGDPFGYWTPSPLLTRLAEANETISDWAARRSKPETIHA